MNQTNTRSKRRKNSTARSQDQIQNSVEKRSFFLDEIAMDTFIKDCRESGETPVIQVSFPCQDMSPLADEYSSNFRA